MKLWYFTEQQYHPAWEACPGPIRNTPPTGLIDPDDAADLIDRYYEEFAAIDELGLNIAVNEHHTTLQCMSTTPYLSVAALARTTKKARILSIGSPLAQRPDPVRLAEEIALTDIMSRGRTEVGFIKSVPWEYFNSNANPMRLMDRFWEANDLILKALSTRDGPFSWEGRYFHYRNVNIIPRPYQDPHPPIWMAGQSPSSARVIAERKYVAVTSMSGSDAGPFFSAYRDQYKKTHGAAAGKDRLGYICYVAVAHSEAEARKRAQLVHKWVEFLPSQNAGFQHAAGYATAQDFARMLRSGKQLGRFDKDAVPTIDELRERNVMFWGTPDHVYKQIEGFYRRVGGLGHLLTQMGGYATKHDTIESMTLMANEVLPRLQELSQVQLEAA
jgi:alkanesulfonate monooxygenase SsuD/methylene tetrahydromethanopterin reductase-like flavin-dependent oxidoreductase (luciferase family)